MCIYTYILYIYIYIISLRGLQRDYTPVFPTNHRCQGYRDYVGFRVSAFCAWCGLLGGFLLGPRLKSAGLKVLGAVKGLLGCC